MQEQIKAALRRVSLTRFMATGTIAGTAYYAIYVGCTELGVWYILSSTLGFLAYWLVHFVLSKYWVFRSTVPARKVALKHFLMHAVNQCINVAGLYVLVEYVTLHYIIAQVLLSICFEVVVLVRSHTIFKE